MKPWTNWFLWVWTLLATAHNSTKYEKRRFVFRHFDAETTRSGELYLDKRLLVDKTKTFLDVVKKMYWSKFFPFLHVFPFWLKGKLDGESEGVTCCKNHQLNLILLRRRYMSSVVNLLPQSSAHLFWKPLRCSDAGSSGYLAGKETLDGSPEVWRSALQEASVEIKACRPPRRALRCAAGAPSARCYCVLRRRRWRRFKEAFCRNSDRPIWTDTAVENVR